MWIATLFGILIGLALGLTGGGGSIFAVPLLIHGLGVGVHDAVTVSLAAVMVTSAFGAVGAARAQLVEYRAGLIFASAGVVAAPVGVQFGRRIDEQTILITFASLMVLVAVLMWRKAGRAPDDAAIVRADFVPGMDASGGPLCRFSPDSKLRLTAPCSAALGVAGVATGLLSGVFGVGGGFIIVPALTIVSQLSIHRAVATSLFVITLVALSGVVSVVRIGGSVPWVLTAWFAAGGIIGMLLGRTAASRIAGPTLQKVFAAAILVVATYVLGARS